MWLRGLFPSSCPSVTVGISHSTLGTDPVKGKSQKTLFTDWSYGSSEIFMCFLNDLLILVDAPVQGQSWRVLCYTRGTTVIPVLHPVFVIWANFSFNSCVL